MTTTIEKDTEMVTTENLGKNMRTYTLPIIGSPSKFLFDSQSPVLLQRKRPEKESLF